MLMVIAKSAKKDILPTYSANVMNVPSINLISMVQTAMYALKTIIFMITPVINAPKENMV